jgi:large subunit ribosomal protein L18
MMSEISRNERHKRITKRLQGTAAKPRLVVFRSNKNIYAQLVNDKDKKVITACSTLSKDYSSQDAQAQKDAQPLKDGQLPKDAQSSEKNKLIATKNIKAAYAVGKLVAKRAASLGIKEVCFDRAGYKYHGRVRALAEGAREAGLKF